MIESFVLKGLSNRLIPIFRTLTSELAALSWVALVCMLAVSGILMLFGNEYGSKKICKSAIYGFALIQLAAMLL